MRVTDLQSLRAGRRMRFVTVQCVSDINHMYALQNTRESDLRSYEATKALN